MGRAIGIDLGTTYTVAASIEGGKPRILLNAEGQPLTPSVVAFIDGGQPLVGRPAQRQAAARPERTVFSIKRHMGSGFKVRVAKKEYTPEEVSSLILRKVKADAEHMLGEDIDRAVITVPAYFNDRQRQATREAGALAGLEVMRIINEPTAAALAYGLDREEVQTILVWDLGGGTFDVSLLELGEGIFEVRAVSGDTWLGGDDVDSRIVDLLAAEYRRIIGADYPDDAGMRQRLREVAEEAKKRLSWRPSTRVPIPPVDPTHGSVEVDLVREQLEGLIGDLLDRMAGCTRQALNDAGLRPVDIDRVILVGGATRTPAVRQLARSMLGKEPYRYIDPDLGIALGAAVHAGMLLGLIEKAILLDVLPLSLGVETQGGLVARIMQRNTTLPASAARIFTTAADYQPSMDIHILQGERALAADNVSLGQFQLDGIPAARRGAPKVEVAFEADRDGIIRVSATDLWSDRQIDVKVVSTKALDPREIENLIDEARGSIHRDREERERIETRIEAESLLAAAETALGAPTRPQPDPWAQPIAEACGNLRGVLANALAEDIAARARELRGLLVRVAETTSTGAPA